MLVRFKNYTLHFKSSQPPDHPESKYGLLLITYFLSIVGTCSVISNSRRMSSLFFPVNKWGSPRFTYKRIYRLSLSLLPRTLACSTLSMFVPSSFRKVCRACFCSVSVSLSDAIAFSIISISSKVTPVARWGLLRCTYPVIS